MAPTTEEELKLRLFSGDLSQIGPAERFLKVLVETPFAFKRLECLLFMISMSEDVATVKESFTTRGGAQAFKLDTLLKLADVKGTDGKTTFLHFVVTEIIRSEGVRAARSCRESQSLSSIASADIVLDDFTDDSAENYRKLGLQVVSSLSTELVDVKRAAAIDADGLTKMIAKLGQSLMKSKAFINAEMKNLDEDSKFRQSILKFLKDAETDITWIAGEEKNIMALVKSTADYFHGSSGKDEGLRLFTVVRDFLIMLDKTCKQVKDAAAAEAAAAAAAAVAAAATNHGKNSKKETPKLSATSNQRSELRQRLFPAIVERWKGEDSSSSDEEDGDGESSSSSS